jgi:hypothetical protein
MESGPAAFISAGCAPKVGAMLALRRKARSRIGNQYVFSLSSAGALGWGKKLKTVTE